MTLEVSFAAFATWASLVIIATFIGGLGNIYLSERIGINATHVIDVLTMILATYGLSYMFVTAHEIVDARLLLGIGISWSILTVGLELLVGRVTVVVAGGCRWLQVVACHGDWPVKALTINGVVRTA